MTTRSPLPILCLALGLALPAAPVAAGIYCPQTPAEVAVLGDSLADGVWGSLFRGWQGCATVTLHRVTRVSDGLTVTAPETWSARLVDSLGGDVAAADLVIVQFGANDIRALRTEGGRATFGTEAWKSAYGGRVDSLLDHLAGQAGATWWLGLPVVGDAKLEASYVEVSGIQSDATGEWQGGMAARFVDTHEPTKFGTEGFVQSAEIDGRMTQLRAGDLIHFTEKGYDLVAATFLPEVEALLRAKDAEATLKSLALQ
ncbi:DUF459 domain-containing protein [Pseudogemmobacter sonorensis]|uniref:DUF459 domain-containing protein n=1 Tax=Pseudogemmobacter sonorensis TaxID=2989681 RepID=UPI0036C55097